MSFEPKLILSEWSLSWVVPLSPLSSFAKSIHSSWRLLETADKTPPAGGSASCIPDTFWWPLKLWLQPWLVGAARGQPPCSTRRGRKNPAEGFAFSLAYHCTQMELNCSWHRTKMEEGNILTSDNTKSSFTAHKPHNALVTIQFYTPGGPFHSNGSELIIHAFQLQAFTIGNVSIKNSVIAT